MTGTWIISKNVKASDASSNFYDGVKLNYVDNIYERFKVT